MTLAEIRAQFLASGITKPEYIERMHEVHSRLFDYAGYMGATEIAKIEIGDGLVVMTSRKDGVKIICDPQDKRAVPLEILNFMDYENVDSDMIFRLVHDGDHILDIGANVGWYSISLAKRFPKCHIDSFEPLPKTFDYLQRNVALNGASPARLHNHGFSDKAGEITFFYYPAGPGNASSAKLADVEGVQEIKCRVTTLDEFTRARPEPVDFIKVDVEGAELLVFKGGIETLKKHKPVVFSEMLRKWSAKFGYHPNDIIRLFAETGYRCFSAHKDRLREFTAMDEGTVETNFFFLHKEKHATEIRSLGSLG